MSDPDPASPDELSDEARLALAHTPQSLRVRLETVLLLDRRLGRIVSTTSEPMLGQLRLAWWREALESTPGERPRGDAVLDAVSAHLQGVEEALACLVDGWEHLLSAQVLSEAEARAFARGRAEALSAVYRPVCDEGARSEALARAAMCWAYADLAAKVSRDGERAMLASLGLEAGSGQSALPREARGLALLRALGLRALRRGASSLMEGRGAALVALRAGMFGR